MYPTSEVPDAVTACMLDSQLTYPFVSITSASKTERLVSRQAPKSESVYASVLSPHPCLTCRIPHSFLWSRYYVPFFTDLLCTSPEFSQNLAKVCTTQAVFVRVTVTIHIAPTASRYEMFTYFPSPLGFTAYPLSRGLAPPCSGCRHPCPSIQTFFQVAMSSTYATTTISISSYLAKHA